MRSYPSRGILGKKHCGQPSQGIWFPTKSGIWSKGAGTVTVDVYKRQELEDAASIDGCNRFSAFLRIFVPIALPGVVVCAIFSFLYAWGDLAYGMTFIQDQVNPVSYTHLQTPSFMGATKAHVKLQAAYFKGFLGAAEPETVIEGTFELKDGNLVIDVQNMQAATGYNLVVTPAAEEDLVEPPLVSRYHEAYEAEDAQLVGGAVMNGSGGYYASGRAFEMCIRDRCRRVKRGRK